MCGSGWVHFVFFSGVLDAQMRVLKAKLRIMQEELDQLSSEYYKKVSVFQFDMCFHT